MENNAKGGGAGKGDPRRADAKGKKGIHAQRTRLKSTRTPSRCPEQNAKRVT